MHVQAPQSRCRFGIARGDVTPPVGIYHRMWGAATHDRATGVHRPLTTTAMVFQALDAAPSPATEQILIADDHCLLWANEMDSLRATICRDADVAPEQLVVTFSHTHAAGLMGLERGDLPGGELIKPYLERLAGQMAALVREARRSTRPVTITYGMGRCALAAHRDFWDAATKQFVCGLNPHGPTDDSVLVARLTDDDGKLVATMVNYACHPTTLAWQNTLISPDYPGAMRELVEKATSALCVFLQGASGDLGPREGFVGDSEVADRNGRQLGYAVLATLESLPPPGTSYTFQGPVVSGATIGVWEHVALDAARLTQLGRWSVQRWTVELPYRAELPTVTQLQQEMAYWQTEERGARQANDEARARDCRAMVERKNRALSRAASLSPGKAFPFPVILWQIGPAFWVALEAEHYHFLQVELRKRLPGVPIVVTTLANGSRPSYLPVREAYGKGIYQETIAVLAPGCLETLIDVIHEQISLMLD
jgi:hypothetical protein